MVGLAADEGGSGVSDGAEVSVAGKVEVARKGVSLGVISPRTLESQPVPKKIRMVKTTIEERGGTI
jgi:hypothetical protein